MDLFLNPLPYDKILACSKLRAFADDKIDGVKMMISLLGMGENTMRNGGNSGYLHFLLFPQCFPSLLSRRGWVVKS